MAGRVPAGVRAGVSCDARARGCAAATASMSAFADALAAEGGNASHPVHPALEANATHAETSVSVLDCVCAVGHE